MIKQTKREKKFNQKKFFHKNIEDCISGVIKDANHAPSKMKEEKIDICIGTGINTKSQSIKTKVELTRKNTKQKIVGVMASQPEVIEELKKLDNVILLTDEEFLKIQKTSTVHFDACISSVPAFIQMPVKCKRIIGVKGMMPNLNNETLVREEKNLVSVVKKVMSGNQVGVKSDKNGNILMSIGSVNSDLEELKQTVSKILDAIKAVKPKDFKGNSYIKKITFNSTQGLTSHSVLKIQ